MSDAPELPELGELLSALTPPAPVKRKGSLHANTVAELRSMIVTGVLAPGARLNERELCERLSVSRTPVREAIKTLIQDGLLRSLPNHSAVVAELDADEIAALVDVLAAIEALAGELAAARMTDEAVAEIGMLHYRMMLHHSRGELPGYFEANKAFHRRIIELSGNSVLGWVWDLLSLRVDRARYSSNLWPTRWKVATEEHQQILDALGARDPERAGRALRDHVRNGLSGLVAALREREAAPRG
ncbi:GntR family transcriptional regulator [Bosea sp. TWI1241]|uniref:GntR family transcriptional regulator n=1 Tax=Bosea sp. TWI1241 TaxID=3148904 RepID=UPI00320A0A38